MNAFMTAMKNDSNFGYTENGVVKHLTTGSKVYDMFAMGGAYRSRDEHDVLDLFTGAYGEHSELAMKCLFYLRDAREGQGERRFFKTCIHWLATHQADAVKRNLQYIAMFGRWDDFYCLVGTPLEKEMFAYLKEQLTLDVQCKTPSLLAKWLKSENTSSAESRLLGRKTREAFGMTAKQYRKTLSILRERINVLERLMSAGKWDEIEFDKIPSRAGFIYRNAFARHDIERAKSDKNVQTYADFAKDTTTKVNAKVLYPYECVEKAIRVWGRPVEDTERLMVNKYWENLADYIKGATFDGIAVVDTSGSMMGTPMNVAISLGMYCATKAKGPYANHFFSFSNRPEFLEVHGHDFVEKVRNIVDDADWGGSTNVEAVFDKILQIAIDNKLAQEDIPGKVIVISDMEFNACVSSNSNSGYSYFGSYGNRSFNKDTLFEAMAKKWAQFGYKLPRLIFWNVDARSNNIPMKDDGNVTYVSGFSPVIYEQIMKNKTSIDLMLDKLMSERYACIH